MNTSLKLSLLYLRLHLKQIEAELERLIKMENDFDKEDQAGLQGNLREEQKSIKAKSVKRASKKASEAD